MKINWMAISETDDIDINMWFQRPEMPAFFRTQLVKQYPEIDKDLLNTLPWDRAQEYLRTKLSEIYKKHLDGINAKVKECMDFFDDEKMREISTDFSNAFGVNCHQIFNNISGRVGTNPIRPRWINDDGKFDMPFFCNIDSIKQFAIHEIVHFVWFRIWHEHFKDSWDEYEQPHLKWVLSEIVVDPIIRYSDLSKYFPDIENDRTIAYNYFYDMEIDGAPILKTMADFYQGGSIIQFMEKAYAYCVAHEAQLREKIAIAESK